MNTVGSARPPCSTKTHVPEDVRRRCKLVKDREAWQDAPLKLGVSEATLNELISLGGMVRRDVLERVEKKLALLGVR